MKPKSLSRSALVTMTVARFLAAFIFIGCMLFLPAGTLGYWEAWLYMGLLFILLGYLLFVLTIRENRFAPRVVEVQENQVVIRTGPCALVRHPMYLAVSVIFTFTSLALGSFWALIPALLLPVVLAARIGNEEQLLRRDLPGYVEYCQKVKYRVLPFIW